MAIAISGHIIFKEKYLIAFISFRAVGICNSNLDITNEFEKPLLLKLQA